MDKKPTSTEIVSMAKTVLEMADAIERTELKIKEELLSAANDEDFEKVKEIVIRWMKGPVFNVLMTNDSSNN